MRPSPSHDSDEHGFGRRRQRSRQDVFGGVLRGRCFSISPADTGIARRQLARGAGDRSCRMKLLISAYACAPNRGSEHGSGWNWTSEVARLGYDATVLVSSAHRAAILAAVQQDPALQQIRWVFPEVAAWPLQQGKEPAWERTYNLLWQREALRAARALHGERPFDLVHHLTWAGVRAPTFLGTLGAWRDAGLQDRGWA